MDNFGGGVYYLCTDVAPNAPKVDLARTHIPRMAQYLKTLANASVFFVRPKIGLIGFVF